MSNRNNDFSPEQLDRIAEKLHTEIGLDNAMFIDITELAEQMGIDVYEVDFEEKDLLGVYFTKDEDKYIYIDEDIAEGDKRFVIATQLAHIILGHNNSKNQDEYLADYKEPFKGCTTPEHFGSKTQAIYLATALLMPANSVKQVWEQSENIDLVVNQFRVSMKVATLRLDNLGLI